MRFVGNMKSRTVALEVWRVQYGAQNYRVHFVGTTKVSRTVAGVVWCGVGVEIKRKGAFRGQREEAPLGAVAGVWCDVN